MDRQCPMIFNGMLTVVLIAIFCITLWSHSGDGALVAGVMLIIQWVGVSRS